MTDKDRYLNQFYHRYKVGATRRDIPFELTKDDFAKLWKRPCWYCGARIWPIGIDRIDNGQGYTPHNIVACCTDCNMMKRGMRVETFLTHCRRITQYNSLT